jgi:hypothetical protein
VARRFGSHRGPIESGSCAIRRRWRQSSFGGGFSGTPSGGYSGGIGGGGNRHPIIRVPSHDASPICARANGPVVNDRIQGIVAGRNYTRQVGSTGPESVIITSPTQWAPIFRRCVAAERTTLVGIIEQFLDPTRTISSSAIDTLEQWHDAAASKFRDLVPSLKLVWPTPLEHNFYQFSYEFIGVEGELPTKDMFEILERANAEMRDLVWTGWSMFYPFRRTEIAPYIVHDAFPGQGTTEVLETSLLGSESSTSTLPDFWRVATNGKATIVRAFREDRSGYKHKAGTTWSPFMATRDLTEFARHARALATQFNRVQSVRFRCEWHSLKGRELRDQESDWSVERIAKTDRVLSTLERPVQDLTVSWQAIVSALVSKVARAFDPTLDLSPEWVARVSRLFRTL